MAHACLELQFIGYGLSNKDTIKTHSTLRYNSYFSQ